WPDPLRAQEQLRRDRPSADHQRLQQWQVRHRHRPVHAQVLRQGQRHRAGAQRRLSGRQAGSAERAPDPGAGRRPAPDRPPGRRLRPDREPRRARRQAHLGNAGLRLRHHAVGAGGVLPVRRGAQPQPDGARRRRQEPAAGRARAPRHL
ncbi:hypothetical protein OY671_012637, partial [Metschnikowia pulcherrima]